MGEIIMGRENYPGCKKKVDNKIFNKSKGLCYKCCPKILTEKLWHKNNKTGLRHTDSTSFMFVVEHVKGIKYKYHHEWLNRVRAGTRTITSKDIKNVSQWKKIPGANREVRCENEHCQRDVYDGPCPVEEFDKGKGQFGFHLGKEIW